MAQPCQKQDAVSHLPLTAREVCQVLRDIALGLRVMRRGDALPMSGLSSECTWVQADGWTLALCTAEGELISCSACQSPDGRCGSEATWQRYGTDPVHLLSTWELGQVRRLLSAL